MRQNIRAASLISKHLTSVLLLSLKRSSENQRWTPAAFFLNSWMVIKTTVALLKESEVCLLRLKHVRSIPISPRWSTTGPRDWEQRLRFALRSASSSIASFTSPFSLALRPPQPVPVTQSAVAWQAGLGNWAGTWNHPAKRGHALVLSRAGTAAALALWWREVGRGGGH